MGAISSLGLNRRNLNLLAGDQGGPYSLILLGQGANAGTIIVDSSQYGQLPTTNQGVTTSTGQIYAGVSSLLFNAAGQTFLDYPPQLFNPGYSDYTLEAVIYPTTIAGSQRDILNFASAVGALGIVFDFLISAGGVLIFRTASGTTLAQVTGGGIVINAWQHVAAVRQGGTLRVYRNGVQIGSAAGPAAGRPINYATPVANGARPRVGTSFIAPGLAFDGYMTNVRATFGLCLYPNGTAFVPPAGLFSSPVL